MLIGLVLFDTYSDDDEKKENLLLEVKAQFASALFVDSLPLTRPDYTSLTFFLFTCKQGDELNSIGYG